MKEKNCYCHTCQREFHYLGIAGHRSKHRDRNEDCEITYTNGETHRYNFSGNNTPGEIAMNYLIRDIPEDLWRKFKSIAALKGMSIKDMLIKLIMDAVVHEDRK